MSKAITLRRTAMPDQFVDERGRLWVRNNTRKPSSNPPETIWCTICGLALGPVAYMRQTTSGPVACYRCVEIVPPPAPDRDERAIKDEQRRRMDAASEVYE